MIKIKEKKIYYLFKYKYNLKLKKKENCLKFIKKYEIYIKILFEI